MLRGSQYRSPSFASSSCRDLPATTGVQPAMFFFFSNRTGCIGSLLINLVGSLVLLVLLGIIRL